MEDLCSKLRKRRTVLSETEISEGRKWGVRSVVVEFGVFGAPRFSVQRSQDPLKKVFGDLWTENWGAPKTPNSTTTDLTPLCGPLRFRHFRAKNTPLGSIVWRPMKGVCAPQKGFIPSVAASLEGFLRGSKKLSWSNPSLNGEPILTPHMPS